MQGNVPIRIAAIVFVAIAITASLIDMARDEGPAPVSTAPEMQPSADPLRATLQRCQQLGEAAGDDAECLAAWAQSRDRFLGRGSDPVPSEGS